MGENIKNVIQVSIKSYGSYLIDRIKIFKNLIF